MKNNEVIPIKGWMINEAKLQGSELIVFAWICTSNKWRRFNVAELAYELGIKRGQVQYYLNNLCANHNIKKRKVIVDNKVVIEFKTELKT